MACVSSFDSDSAAALASNHTTAESTNDPVSSPASNPTLEPDNYPTPLSASSANTSVDKAAYSSAAVSTVTSATIDTEAKELSSNALEIQQPSESMQPPSATQDKTQSPATASGTEAMQLQSTVVSSCTAEPEQQPMVISSLTSSTSVSDKTSALETSDDNSQALQVVAEAPRAESTHWGDKINEDEEDEVDFTGFFSQMCQSL
jgi:hypothetical protein